jgi:hypothetical protein
MEMEMEMRMEMGEKGKAPFVRNSELADYIFGAGLLLSVIFSTGDGRQVTDGGDSELGFSGQPPR